MFTTLFNYQIFIYNKEVYHNFTPCHFNLSAADLSYVEKGELVQVDLFSEKAIFRNVLKSNQSAKVLLYRLTTQS